MHVVIVQVYLFAGKDPVPLSASVYTAIKEVIKEIKDNCPVYRYNNYM